MTVDESEFEHDVEIGIEQDEKVPYVPGTVYFMTEIDFLNGQRFPYYKIGIVKNDKEVEVRKKQHRTGNPRDIISVRDIVSPAAQKLETRLHNEFASNRVASGEWFHFSEEMLEVAIARALDLNAQLIDEINLLNSAQNISGPGSNAVLAADTGIQSDAESLGILTAEKSVISQIKASLSKEIKRLAEGDPQWERLFEARQNSEKNAFNVAILKKKNKSLYDQFQTIEKQSVSPNWIVEVPAVDADAVAEKYGCLPADSLGSDPLGLHQAYLRVWSASAKIDWEIERIVARLLNVAKDSNGISGVLEWKVTNSKSFDKKAFIDKHPDVYNDCFKKTEAHVSYRVVEWASYSF